MLGGGLATRDSAGGASSDIMDPRPENLNPGISVDVARGGMDGIQICGK